jgi:hypothetical protein
MACTYEYFPKASLMTPKATFVCSCSLRNLSVGTSSARNSDILSLMFLHKSTSGMSPEGSRGLEEGAGSESMSTPLGWDTLCASVGGMSLSSWMWGDAEVRHEGASEGLIS